ncbi:MAG: M1 family aminopeptidase [Candidatus Promineifilaceae bacterium]
MPANRRAADAAESVFENVNIPLQYPPDLELEPTHLDINLQLDIAAESVSGTVTTTVRARRAGRSEIKLNAMDFQGVEVRDAAGRALSWSYDGALITVNWAEPFERDEERRLEVSYQVTSPADGLYFSHPDEAYPDAPWYVASDHETERARHWLACIDLPNVRTTLDFHLRADARYTILANGYLVEETAHDDGTKTAHWRLEQLCPSYLICFTIGDYVRADDGAFDDGEKQVELAYFSDRQHDQAMLLRSFGRTRDMLAWMTRKLDRPFPWPKYYQFAVGAIFGAMENISLVSWGEFFILDEEMGTELAWLADLVNVHEMAHSYFGDAVVVRDFAHAWLKESWATYIEQVWNEEYLNEDEGLFTFYDHARSYFREADEDYKRPLVTRRFKSSWQLYDRHLYPGGACRLHTLRCELGDEVFWPAVQEYLRRYTGRVVETDDFRDVMEEFSGRSLGKFFDQWFHAPGYPHLKVSFSYDSKQKLGTFEVEQTQADAGKGIPVFALSTNLSWQVKGETRSLPIKLDQARHVFTIKMEAEPEQVRFDPGCKILYKLEFNPGDPMLRRQLTEAPDVVGRILAANELAKTGKRSNIQAIVDAYAQEPFWGARQAFAQALSEANTDAAVAGLAQIVAQESDPRLLAPIFRAAAEYRDPRIGRALSERLAGDLPPLARGAAYHSLGAQRKDADWELLLAGTREPGFHNHAQAGAFRGLGASHRPEAVAILLEALPYGRHAKRLRPHLAAALADIGQGLEKARREIVVEALLDLLRDPWPATRRAAARGLATVKAAEAIPSLEAYGRSLSHQERVALDEVISGLRESDKSDGSALKKQVEDLRDKVRKLEEQLQKLEGRIEPAA